MAADEMKVTEFTDFLTRAFRNMADVSLDGSIHYLCMDWRHIGEMPEAGQGILAFRLSICAHQAGS